MVSFSLIIKLLNVPKLSTETQVELNKCGFRRSCVCVGFDEDNPIWVITFYFHYCSGVFLRIKSQVIWSTIGQWIFHYKIVINHHNSSCNSVFPQSTKHRDREKRSFKNALGHSYRSTKPKPPHHTTVEIMNLSHNQYENLVKVWMRWYHARTS